MGSKGSALVTAVLLAVALALFAPVFGEAANEYTYDGWTYAEYASTAISVAPVLLAAAALMILGAPLIQGGP